MPFCSALPRQSNGDLPFRLWALYSRQAVLYLFAKSRNTGIKRAIGHIPRIFVAIGRHWLAIRLFRSNFAFQTAFLEAKNPS